MFYFSDPQAAKRPLDEAEDKAVARLGITYGVLRRLGFSEARVNECLNAINGVDLDEAYEWVSHHFITLDDSISTVWQLYIHCTEEELGDKSTPCFIVAFVHSKPVSIKLFMISKNHRPLVPLAHLSPELLAHHVRRPSFWRLLPRHLRKNFLVSTLMLPPLFPRQSFLQTCLITTSIMEARPVRILCIWQLLIAMQATQVRSASRLR